MSSTTTAQPPPSSAGGGVTGSGTPPASGAGAGAGGGSGLFTPDIPLMGGYPEGYGKIPYFASLNLTRRKQFKPQHIDNIDVGVYGKTGISYNSKPIIDTRKEHPVIKVPKETVITDTHNRVEHWYKPKPNKYLKPLRQLKIPTFEYKEHLYHTKNSVQNEDSGFGPQGFRKGGGEGTEGTVESGDVLSNLDLDPVDSVDDLPLSDKEFFRENIFDPQEHENVKLSGDDAEEYLTKHSKHYVHHLMSSGIRIKEFEFDGGKHHRHPHDKDEHSEHFRKRAGLHDYTHENPHVKNIVDSYVDKLLKLQHKNETTGSITKEELVDLMEAEKRVERVNKPHVELEQESFETVNKQMKERTNGVVNGIDDLENKIEELEKLIKDHIPRGDEGFDVLKENFNKELDELIKFTRTHTKRTFETAPPTKDRHKGLLKNMSDVSEEYIDTAGDIIAYINGLDVDKIDNETLGKITDIYHSGEDVLEYTVNAINYIHNIGLNLRHVNSHTSHLLVSTAEEMIMYYKKGKKGDAEAKRQELSNLLEKITGKKQKMPTLQYQPSSVDKWISASGLDPSSISNDTRSEIGMLLMHAGSPDEKMREDAIELLNGIVKDHTVKKSDTSKKTNAEISYETILKNKSINEADVAEDDKQKIIDIINSDAKQKTKKGKWDKILKKYSKSTEPTPKSTDQKKIVEDILADESSSDEDDEPEPTDEEVLEDEYQNQLVNAGIDSKDVSEDDKNKIKMLIDKVMNGDIQVSKLNEAMDELKAKLKPRTPSPPNTPPKEEFSTPLGVPPSPTKKTPSARATSPFSPTRKGPVVTEPVDVEEIKELYDTSDDAQPAYVKNKLINDEIDKFLEQLNIDADINAFDIQDRKDAQKYFKEMLENPKDVDLSDKFLSIVGKYEKVPTTGTKQAKAEGTEEPKKEEKKPEKTEEPKKEKENPLETVEENKDIRFSDKPTKYVTVPKVLTPNFIEEANKFILELQPRKSLLTNIANTLKYRGDDEDHIKSVKTMIGLVHRGYTNKADDAAEESLKNISPALSSKAVKMFDNALKNADLSKESDIRKLVTVADKAMSLPKERRLSTTSYPENTNKKEQVREKIKALRKLYDNANETKKRVILEEFGNLQKGGVKTNAEQELLDAYDKLLYEQKEHVDGRKFYDAIHKYPKASGSEFHELPQSFYDAIKTDNIKNKDTFNRYVARNATYRQLANILASAPSKQVYNRYAKIMSEKIGKQGSIPHYPKNKDYGTSKNRHNKVKSHLKIAGIDIDKKK